MNATTEPSRALDPEATYGVDDGDGNAITDGLQAHDAEQVAQKIADERGESVYLYDSRPLTEDEIMDDVARPAIEITPSRGGA